ncbi:fatty acid 2-hydroxylase [Elysia marginata]|uniref:Fatty acid 2-hydroxylase n=1 Tax=Elysia marginata TaxID=1093978 RepID=A0AAV4IAE4_9GAST|nr:fatty acid 2-hydroxylase [Elysia marginata]
MRLVFPPVPALFFALVLYTLARLTFPIGMSHSVFAGIVAGYVAYDLTHYYLHQGGTPSIDYFRRLKTYHTLHHYNHQQLGFGISSKLWDYPFGTLIPENLMPRGYK